MKPAHGNRETLVPVHPPPSSLHPIPLLPSLPLSHSSVPPITFPPLLSFSLSLSLSLSLYLSLSLSLSLSFLSIHLSPLTLRVLDVSGGLAKKSALIILITSTSPRTVCGACVCVCMCTCVCTCVCICVCMCVCVCVLEVSSFMQEVTNISLLNLHQTSSQ